MKWLNEFGACSLAAAGMPCDLFDGPALDEDQTDGLEAEPSEPALSLDGEGPSTTHSYRHA